MYDHIKIAKCFDNVSSLTFVTWFVLFRKWNFNLEYNGLKKQYDSKPCDIKHNDHIWYHL